MSFLEDNRVCRLEAVVSAGVVKEGMDFASYLRGDRRDHARPTLTHSRPNPFHKQPVRTFYNPEGYFGAVPTGLSGATSYQKPHVFSYDTMAEAQAVFKSFVSDPDNVYLPTNHFDSHDPTARQLVRAYPSFRPLYGSHHIYSEPMSQEPTKFENSHTLPTPGILQGNVDASKYDPVSYQDWFHAPTEYQSLSPASIASEESTPMTPQEWEVHYTIPTAAGSGLPASMPGHAHFFPPSGNFARPPGSYAFNRETGSFTINRESTAPAHAFTHPHAHGLPSANHALDRLRNALLADTQAPHVSMDSDVASPQDLELQSSPPPAEFDDDTDHDADIEVSTSTPEAEHTLSERERRANERRDELLLRMREERIPYKEIKRLGRFKEAESTLRGRHRALTKERGERVRRPQWLPHDVTLLRQAVRNCSSGHVKKLRSRHGAGKLPWKKISEWMKSSGSSYLFAPATCAKKWASLK